jgi:hypothetical protein
MSQGASVRKIPFPFVLDALEELHPTTKPMFGSLGVYVGDRIVFIMRHKDNHTVDNGLWLATAGEHHESLARVFPSMRSLDMFGPGPTAWQNLPLESPDFEEAALRACELVRLRDPRIGKIPSGKRKAKPKRATATPSGKTARRAANPKAAAKKKKPAPPHRKAPQRTSK